MSVPTVASLVAGLGHHLRPAPGAEPPEVPITAVHISELVDPSAYLSGGELLLTTGLSLPDEEDEVRAYVARLTIARVAALGLGLGPTFQKVPVRLATACRDAGLALLVVPSPTPFVTISRAYWTQVARSGELLLTDQLAAQRALVDAAASADPTAAILRTLAEWLRGWAATLTADGEPAQAHPPSALAETAGLRQELRSVRPGGTRAALALVAGDRRVLVFPLGPAGEERGYLAVASNRSIDPAARRTVLAAASLLGLVASRSAIAHAAATARLGDVALLLDLGEVEAARRLAEAGALPVPGDHVQVLAVRGATPARLADAVGRWRAPAGAAYVDGGRAWFVLPAAGAAPEALVDPLRRLGGELAATLSLPVRVGETGAERLRRLAVLDALPDGRLDLPEEETARMSDLVAGLDPALLEAVEAYLRHRGHWERAARALHAHRNTLRYRIRRAEEVLGVDLDDPDVAASTWLALRARDRAGS